MYLAPTAPAQAPVLKLKLAQSCGEIEEALRLRYRVFVEEAHNQALAHPSGLEQDEYDAVCDHLIVRDQNTAEVVGTYRLLPGERALRYRGFYSETEFDLSAFQRYRPTALELGRSCVAAAYRGTRAIQMLWGGIADYLSDNPHTHLIGCASLHLAERSELSELYSMLKQHDMITERFGVAPRPTHRIQDLASTPSTCSEKELLRRLPPLLKGYHWMGAEIAGEPAYDPIFNTTDFFVVFDTTQMTKRYQRHFATSYRASQAA
ncbi:MAG: GNAT family N-acetyltransferase [Herpetosiphonaceae bacterium]|nr:GNAT family N-acetyltransferase [Herpetosiphonaceae bacterium]